jgi:hypothetical protein
MACSEQEFRSKETSKSLISSYFTPDILRHEVDGRFISLLVLPATLPVYDVKN